MPTDWVRGYARQADADFRAWELYADHPEAVAAECHRLLFLQMACEKLCKAWLIQGGTTPESLRTSHAYVAKHLSVIIRERILDSRPHLKGMSWVLRRVRHWANEIEVLNPAVDRNGQRPDNCEYPWEVGDGTILSPLEHSFEPSNLLTDATGRTFLKLVRDAINRLL